MEVVTDGHVTNEKMGTPMTRPTHALIDDKIHTIVKIEAPDLEDPNAPEEPDGSSEEEPKKPQKPTFAAHTHRVHFACGMLFDVRGEHQFDHHRVDHGDRLTEHDPKRLVEIKVLGDAHQIQLDKHAPLFADERDKHETLTALQATLAKPGYVETEEDAVYAAKLAFAIRKMKPDIEAANAAITAAREAHAHATADLHKTRKGRDKRWVMNGDDMKAAIKLAKTPCEGCAAHNAKSA